MATKLFLLNTTTNGITDSGDGVLYDMDTVAGAASDDDIVTLTDGGTEIQWTQSAGGSSIAWISGRAPSGGFTLTTTDISVWLLESNMNDEAEGRYRVFKYDGILHTVTELLGGPFDDGAELGTTITEMTWAGNVTDTIFLENDRILVRLYATNFTTMTAGTATLRFNAANAATGDSFFNIAETVTFKANAVIRSTALSGAGAAVATAAGASRASVALSGAGASTATAAGAAMASATISSTGASTGTLSALAIEIQATALSSTGSATATAATASIAAAPLSAAGTATATADAASTAGATLSAAGVAVGTVEGASLAAGDLQATGSSTTTADAATLASSDLASTGTSTATAEGAAIAAAGAEAALSAAGTSTAILEGVAVGGAPADEEEEPTVPQGEGGMITRNDTWAKERRRRRREIEIEEADLLLIARAAAEQIGRDHVTRNTTR